MAKLRTSGSSRPARSSSTRRTFLQATLAAAIAAACTRRREQGAPTSPLMGVIPAPLQVIPGTGQFNLRAGTALEHVGAGLAPLVEGFRAEIARRTGVTLAPARIADTTPGPSIRIEVAAAIDNDFDALPMPMGVSPAGDEVPDERYSLTIAEDGVALRGVAPIGVARGLASLVQLIASTPKDAHDVIGIPAARILDVPRFAWRGLTFDLSRTFFATAEIKRVVDLVALYKLNVLHLPLTGDRGWRLEAGRPQERGAPDGTFYSNAQLRELVRYAAERFVTLVPGLDVPGHAGALLKLRPELASGRNAPGSGFSAWLDPDLPATFALIDQVLAEVAAIFPGPFLHLGGEAPVDMPEDSYVACVQHVRERLRTFGKRPMGWQESTRAGVDVHEVLQFSTSSERFGPGLVQGEGRHPLPSVLPSAAAGNLSPSRDAFEPALLHSVPVIVSPVEHACFDVPYAERSVDRTQEQMRARAGERLYPSKTVAEFFDWEPARTLGSSPGRESLAGVGGVISAATDFEELSFLLLPRLAGVAHKAWSEPRSNIWSEHRQALARHRRLWEQDRLIYFETSTVDW